MEFLIVSGLSGGGKSRAADVLEDLDFYCVDNMPTALLTKFAELCLATRGRYEKVALVTDIRSQESFTELFAALDELADSLSEADSGGRLKLASQKFYFAGLVACIENLCLSPHGVSSIERSARMRDMLDAPRTRQMVAALKDNHRGLGLLFGPIASAKPARCVMCTHLAAFLNRTGAKTA